MESPFNGMASVWKALITTMTTTLTFGQCHACQCWCQSWPSSHHRYHANVTGAARPLHLFDSGWSVDSPAKAWLTDSTASVSCWMPFLQQGWCVNASSNFVSCKPFHSLDSGGSLYSWHRLVKFSQAPGCRLRRLPLWSLKSVNFSILFKFSLHRSSVRTFSTWQAESPHVILHIVQSQGIAVGGIKALDIMFLTIVIAFTMQMRVC